MNRKRVLFIAYHFPPVGGAGVQRSLKFVEHLPDFGFEPIVVTGRGPSGARWTPADASLLTSVPQGVEVRRVAAVEPEESAGWRARAERWLRIGRPFREWWTAGVLDAAAAVGPVDLVYASMSPFESAEAAAAVAARVGCPWVADLRDPWALDEMQIQPTGLHRHLETRRMRRALDSADAVVMNTPEATAALLHRFPQLRHKLVTTISNGFDLRDFQTPEPVRSDDAFRIVHTGYLHTDLGRLQQRRRTTLRILRGAIGEVDILTRSHVYLLDALRRLRARRPELSGRLELHLAGIISEADRSAFSSEDWIVLHGYLPHAQSVDLVRSADLLFLPMHNLPEGTRSRIVPGKTYEYLASRRQVLAAVPDGDARDLLSLHPHVLLCRPDDDIAMERLVEEAMDNGAPNASPRSISLDDGVAQFERRRLTESLAAIFDEAMTRANARRDVCANQLAIPAHG